MTTYEIQYLQAVEHEQLPRDQGVGVFVHAELDGMGFHEVTLSSDDRDRLVEYLREQWGDEDRDWFDDRVASIVEIAARPTCGACGTDDLCFGVTEDDVEDGTYVCEECHHEGRVEATS